MSEPHNRPTLLIGDAQDRRVQGFAEAWNRLGGSCTILPHMRLLPDAGRLASVLAPGTLFRIESFGTCARTRRALVQLGWDLGAPRLTGHIDEVGEIWETPALARGWQAYLARLGEIARDHSAHLIRPPEDIWAMCDKLTTRSRLENAGVAMPACAGSVANTDEIMTAMQNNGWNAAFLKLRHGSSASGVMAIRHQGDRSCAYAAIDQQSAPGGRVRLFNRLRIQRMPNQTVWSPVADEICRHGAYLEQWLPKRSDSRGRACDLRIVAIAGRLRHRVLRTSRGPITNLHLGNQRGDWSAFWHSLGADGRRRVTTIAENATRCFPSSLCFGLDILIPSGPSKPRVLEVNAFGDLLPGLEHEGECTHTAQAKAFWPEANAACTGLAY